MRRPAAAHMLLETEHVTQSNFGSSEDFITEQLKIVPETSSAFDIGDGIIFENHPHAISDMGEEVVDRATPSTLPRTPNQRYGFHQLRADQICVYRSDSTQSSGRAMLYISEYKLPHKLTAPHLRLGLRPMDISEWTDEGGVKDLYVGKDYPTSCTAAFDAKLGIGIISGLYAKGILVWREKSAITHV